MLLFWFVKIDVFYFSGIDQIRRYIPPLVTGRKLVLLLFAVFNHIHPEHFALVLCQPKVAHRFVFIPVSSLDQNSLYLCDQRLGCVVIKKNAIYPVKIKVPPELPLD